VNKKGQTDGFTLDDYVDATEAYLGKGRINFVVFNTGQPSPELIKKYKDESELVTFDQSLRAERHYQVVQADLLSSQEIRFQKADVLAKTRAFIRHDSNKLAKVLMALFDREL
jgi:2-phospho-L-lactate transferase/gluconeogenesis factor (CofD/UPF0052 family)